MEKKPQFYSKTVEKAIFIINGISNNKSISISELSKKLKYDRATTYRIINTLFENGFLIKKENKYKLSAKFLNISLKLLEEMDIREIARPRLEELSNISDEVIYLTILENDELIIIDKIDSKQSIRIFSKIGQRLPLYCTATGKIFLSYLPEEKTNRILTEIKMEKHTPNTITDIQILKKQFSEIRQKGYAIGDSEYDIYKRTIGAPIFNHGREIVACIAIAGTINTLTDDKLYKLIEPVKNIASEISKTLGLL